MRRDRETAAFMDGFADLARRFPLKIGERPADAKKMAISCSHLHAGQNQEVIDRKTIEPHQTLIEQVTDSVARVVISNCYAVQPFCARGGDHVFRAGYTIPGKKRMRVQVDIERHFSEVNLERAKWKALEGL